MSNLNATSSSGLTRGSQEEDTFWRSQTLAHAKQRSAKLTPQQRHATNPDISARVVANAGTGKTQVLTARVLRLLLAGVKPGKILCLTYTKAAAAEMNTRIADKLRGWVLASDADLRNDLHALLEQEPDEKQIKIARQLFTFTLESTPPARIQTIHSFCQEVLKRFPLESGVEPYFEVIDNITSDELMKETKQQLLSGQHKNAEVNTAITYLPAEAAEFKFNKIISNILSERNKIREVFENGSAEQIIAALYKDSSIDSTRTAAALQDEYLEQNEVTLRDFVRCLSASGKADAKRAEQLAKAIDTKNHRELLDFFYTKETDPQPRKTLMNKPALALLAGGEDKLLFEQNKFVELTERLRLIADLNFTKNVIYLAHGLLDAYEEVKSGYGALDYNDLIYYTRKLLTSASSAAWVLYKLDGGIDHILVDEAQDTSPEQWQIILSLLDEFFAGEGAREHNRSVLIVGDEKQSIYSFQGADPEQFHNVHEFVRKKVAAANKEFHDIPLERSFRSVAAVLNVVDKVFESEALKNAITATGAKINHEVSRINDGGLVKIWPLISADDKEERDKWSIDFTVTNQRSADLLLAENIADMIDGWLREKRILKSTGKPIKPSDIVILLRRRNDFADYVIKKLKRKNIEVSGSDRLQLAEHIATEDLISLGKFLLLPQDDLNLASLLKSPLFGRSEDDVFELCYGRNGSMWDALQNNAKFSSLAAELRDLLGKVDYIGVYEFYAHIIDGLGGRKKFIARLGLEVNDIIDEFLELTLQFERSHVSSMQLFIHWICASNTEIKRDMEQANKNIRVMTVHASKGLEAPIVILPDTTGMPKDNTQRIPQIIWDDGLFYSYRSKPSASGKIKALLEVEDLKDENEYQRLLYVALTRARDELHVMGAKRDKKDINDKCWYRSVENALGEAKVYETEQKAMPQLTVEAAPQKQSYMLPEFMRKDAAKEVAANNEYEEQKFDEKNAASAVRGKKIHRVLERISAVPENKRAQFIEQSLDNVEDINIVKSIVSNKEFAEIFSPNALAEISLIGDVDGKPKLYRIDRLIVSNDTVEIIDFKTDQKVPIYTYEDYKKQMVVYKNLVSRLYPGKLVKGKILWTQTSELREVD